MKKLLGIALLTVLVLPAPPAGANGALVLETPVRGALTRVFSPGEHAWSSGHRGVDLAAHPGATVSAGASGVVWFAGTVAGVPSVSIDHGGGLRTTYTPVDPSVTTGATVAAGDTIGTVLPGHCETTCLHWGLTDGTRYFDPTAYLAVRSIGLLPLGTAPSPPAPLAAAALVGGLPVEGALSSPFGMRRHPITGVYKLHDGADLAAPCGTPVKVPSAGTVVAVETHRAYGIRVIVEHGRLRTGYAHLRSANVTAGDRLAAGTVLGRVGSTGLSTGCHLHWMAWVDGRLVDPTGLGR